MKHQEFLLTTVRILLNVFELLSNIPTVSSQSKVLLSESIRERSLDFLDQMVQENQQHSIWSQLN